MLCAMRMRPNIFRKQIKKIYKMTSQNFGISASRFEQQVKTVIMRTRRFFLIHDRLSSVKCVTVHLPPSDFPSERASPTSNNPSIRGRRHSRPTCLHAASPPGKERTRASERALVRFLELSPARARLVTLLGLICVKISSTCPPSLCCIPNMCKSNI